MPLILDFTSCCSITAKIGHAADLNCHCVHNSSGQQHIRNFTSKRGLWLSPIGINAHGLLVFRKNYSPSLMKQSQSFIDCTTLNIIFPPIVAELVRSLCTQNAVLITRRSRSHGQCGNVIFYLKQKFPMSLFLLSTKDYLFPISLLHL